MQLKVSELSEITGLTTGDLLHSPQDDGSGAYVSKKITFDNVMGSIVKVGFAENGYVKTTNSNGTLLIDTGVYVGGGGDTNHVAYFDSPTSVTGSSNFVYDAGMPSLNLQGSFYHTGTAYITGGLNVTGQVLADGGYLNSYAPILVSQRKDGGVYTETVPSIILSNETITNGSHSNLAFSVSTGGIPYAMMVGTYSDYTGNFGGLSFHTNSVEGSGIRMSISDGGNVSISGNYATTIPLTIISAASSTGSAQEWITPYGSTGAKIDALGNFTLGEGVNVNIGVTGGIVLASGGTTTFQEEGQIIFSSGGYVVTDSGVGLKIATDTGQMLSFYGVAPITQPSGILDPSGGAVIDTEARAAINDIIDRLMTLGLIG